MIFKDILKVPALIPAQFPYKIILFSIKSYEQVKTLMNICGNLEKTIKIDKISTSIPFGGPIGRSGACQLGPGSRVTLVHSLGSAVVQEHALEPSGVL